jgi:hypothetical protein
MSEDKSTVGKIGFLVSLIPVTIIIVATQMRSQIIRDLYWPLFVATIFFALLALMLSTASLMRSSRTRWAVAGTTLGAIELAYMIFAIMSNLGLLGRVIQ